jgi:hypothetical protein
MSGEPTIMPTANAVITGDHELSRPHQEGSGREHIDESREAARRVRVVRFSCGHAVH